MKNNSIPSFVTIIFFFLLGWLLLIWTPYLQFGSQKLHEDQESGDLVPRPLSGLAIRGSKIYEENGCATCHTQQARNSNEDKVQGYSKRASVARDFFYQPATFAGMNRFGPDLTNVGSRKKSAEWHHQHLFAPQTLSPGSIMPSYQFLYEKRKIVGQHSGEALKLPSSVLIEEGYEVIPSEQAKALVAYLLSLDQSYSLPESPLIEE